MCVCVCVLQLNNKEFITNPVHSNSSFSWRSQFLFHVFILSVYIKNDATSRFEVKDGRSIAFIVEL